MSGERILIRGGRVIDPANQLDTAADVYVAAGKILSVGTEPEGFAADQVIEASGLIVCPGLIDLSVRLREPGLEHKATLASETQAAAAAGVTTACCPPDTQPVIDTPAMVKLIQERASEIGKARVLPVGALTRGLNGKDLSEMCALKEAGCLAVSNAMRALANALVLRRALEYASSHELLVILRPEDPWLRGEGCVHEGAVGSRLGLPGIPAAAETVALAQALVLAEHTGARVHFGQLSCASSVGMLARARERGLAVTADVAVHQLHLTEDAVSGFDAEAHVLPPLRSDRDRNKLREGIVAGSIQAICSDHQPHDEAAKLNAFPSTEPGISSLETLLPLTLDLVQAGLLTLNTAIARLTCDPAAILGIEAGSLRSGLSADICVFDPQLEWEVGETNWVSSGRNTPFWGTRLRGRVMHTLLAGKTVFRR